VPKNLSGGRGARWRGAKRLAPFMVDLAVAMGTFSTGRRSKMPTEKETGAVDDGTMTTDGGVVKGVDSELGELILGCRGVSAVSLLPVKRTHLM
jgi:hypothetical protein